MSPPVFNINISNKFIVLSLHVQLPQEGHVASNSSDIIEYIYGRVNSSTYVLETAPTPQNSSPVFSKDSLEANKSSYRKSCSTDWSHSKSIQQSILSCVNSNEDHSHDLTIALRHKSLKDIVSKAGAIIPK